jgi:LacI family transcriptional regulator
MKFEAVTIKDIAKALGLSTSTVSRALRDSYEISEQTKQLVKEYARKINYSPNPIALSLKEKRSRSIGVMVCEIANSFFSQVIDGIESIAYNKGYNIIISQSHESYEREVFDLQYLASRSIDGLLISVSTETQDFGHLKALHAKGFPIVFFDRIVRDIQTHKVIVDNFSGAYNIISHLIRNGYTRIANIATSPYLSIAQDRIGGYQQALADHNMPADKSLLKYCTHGGMIYKELEQALDQLLRLKHRPDAIFAASDKLTTGCLRYFQSKKIKVPDEIALAGFSNSELTELLNPSLTVVKQPAFEMGQLATSLLLELIEAKRPVREFDTQVLPTELFIRDSSAKR